MVVLGMFFMTTLVLQLFFNINYMIPCLFKTLFHIKCFGCGITTAFIKLLQLDFMGAYQTNSLIFVVLPLGVFVVYKDYRNFNKV